MFRAPTRIRIQAGCLDQLPERLHEEQHQRAFLVTDPGLLQTEWPAKLIDALERGACFVGAYSAVEENPSIATAEEIGAELKELEADVVLALGGGSVLDAAKAAACFAAQGVSIHDCIEEPSRIQSSLPVFAIPSTCGTGSEVTWVSVLSDPGTRTKLSMKGDAMFPRAAFMDPRLLESLPDSLLLTTALDAFTHAIEAMTGRRANAVSDALAIEAMGRILSSLPAVLEGKQERSLALLTSLHSASTLAGLAFGNSDVGAVHCLSETLGGRFGVAHGLGNALLLLPCLRHQKTAMAEVLVSVGQRLFRTNEQDPEAAFLQPLQEFLDGLPLASFESLGIPSTEDAELARIATTNGSNASCPKPLSEEDYAQILDSARGS